AIEETIATLASGLPPDEIERLIKDLTPDEESGSRPAVRAGGGTARPARRASSRRDGVPGGPAAGGRRRVGQVAQAEDQPDEGPRRWLTRTPPAISLCSTPRS